MKDKFIALVFIILWSIVYYVSLDMISYEYVEIKNIYIESNSIPWKNKYGESINLYFKAELIEPTKIYKNNNNQTCQINILNSVMIKKMIKNIEESNTKYYTIVGKNNMCSKPITFINIIIENILINIFMIFISLIFCLFIFNIFYTIYEIKKKDYINEDEKNKLDYV